MIRARWTALHRADPFATAATMDRLRLLSQASRHASTSARPSLSRPATTASPSLSPSPAQPRSSPRRYPLRKRFLFEAYSHMFRANEVLLLFKHDSLTPKEWNAVRAGLMKVAAKDPKAAEGKHKVKIEVLRTGLLPPVVRKLPFPSTSKRLISPHLNGPLLALTQSSLSPPILAKSLDVLAKHSVLPSAAQTALIATRKKSDPPLNVDRLPFVLALVNGQPVDKTSLDRIKKLPSLDQLRGQIVGLVGMTAGRLAGTLSQAAGGKLLRTVEGYRIGLEKAQEGASDKPPAE